jgi:hypothetical protein
VPIGHVQLTLFGARRGYLANTRSLCQHQPAVTVAFGAQNGKTLTRKVPIKTACGAKQQRPRPHPH